MLEFVWRIRTAFLLFFYRVSGIFFVCSSFLKEEAVVLVGMFRRSGQDEPLFPLCRAVVSGRMFLFCVFFSFYRNFLFNLPILIDKYNGKEIRLFLRIRHTALRCEYYNV